MPRGKKYEVEEEEKEGEPEGQCKDCQYYDVDREDEDVTAETLAACIHPDLEEYELTVSGDSGCNLFEPYEGEDDDEEEEDEDEEKGVDEEY